MAIGARVRERLGRHERRAASLYRGIFLDLRHYGTKLAGWASGVERILEVGCGEGAVTEILAETFPTADITAIDITPRAGRLYSGRQSGVTFREAPIQQLAAERPGDFDLVLLSDVMHHIPLGMRPEILEAVSRCVRPGGRFVLKDWARAATPIHWLCHGGDRWLTGDRVAYMTPDEAIALVQAVLPSYYPVASDQIRPWSNNYAFVFQC